MGILGTSKYRTYVLNDASIVSKAKFYIMNDKWDPVWGFKVDKILPVQINPESIGGLNAFPYLRGVSGVGDPEGPTMQKIAKLYPGPKDVNKFTNEMNIKLKYNIYDEYKVATMDGMLGAASSLSLENEDATSLYALRCCVPSMALFAWGDIEIFGVITKVSYDYTAFSRWGNPLSADVDVSITEVPLDPENPLAKPTETSKLSVYVKGTVKAEQSSEKIVNTAALLASSAMR